MAHPYHHALSSVKKWGGTVEDFLAVHSWFDQSKEITADFRHRALRHHAEGIFMAETIGRAFQPPSPTGWLMTCFVKNWDLTDWYLLMLWKWRL